MTITVNRKTLILMALLILAMILSLGIFGFIHIEQADREIAESLLFWSIVSAVVSAALFAAVLLKAASLSRSLDRLISQGAHRDLVPGRDFMTLGKLGKQLTTIFNQISRQNLLKARKISSMHDLVEFLVKNAQRPTVVCDVTGVIHYANEDVKESLNIDRMDIMGERLDIVASSIPFADIRAVLLQSRQPEDSIDSQYNFTCYPIENSAGDLAYIVFLFNSKANYFSRRETRQITGTPRWNGLASGIGALMKGRFRNKQ